jgi:hypothetical protein
MTREEILALATQLASALTAEPQTPTQWTDKNDRMLEEIHSSVVPKRSGPIVTHIPIPNPGSNWVSYETVPVGIPTELPTESVESVAPPTTPYPEPAVTPTAIQKATKKAKGFWGKLGAGMKTLGAGLAFGAGGGALTAAVDAVKDGNFNPASIATTAAIAAVTGAIGYYQKGPQKDAPSKPPKG